jgi:DNA repair protein RadC
MNLANPPRNAIGDRAGPRYSLKTFKLTVPACEPGATVDYPKAAVPVLRQILSRLDADQEHFIVLALNTKLQITGFKVIASGGMAGVIVDRRVLFRAALLLGATSVIVAHNHPSDDCTPSPEDRALTQQLLAAGRMLDLQVHDHLILGRDVFSFAESGQPR